MKKKFLFVLFLIVFIQESPAQTPADTVLSRYYSYLSRTERIHPADIDQWIHTLNGKGQWPDINYRDEARANWQLLIHLKRVEELCLAWSNPQSFFYHRAALWKTISLSLNNWLANKYQNPNWWHNQIGVPQCMRDIIVLLKDTLSSRQLQEALKVMDQLRIQKNGAGANTTWSADLGLHYGALTHNLALMDSCSQIIADEIHISTGEGVQPDYSFHQHGARLQMYQYGKAFLFTNIRLAWELRGTPWAFPGNKVNILTDFLLKGWQWMARGINTIPGTMDRSASRVGELRSPDIRYLIPFLIELAPANTQTFKQLKAYQNGEGALAGFRYYPYSDFAAYQTGNFSFFLKTISTRTLPTEVGLNSENLKGKLLNSGDAYLIQNGKEYYDLMPVWNWQDLPGITSFNEAYQIERKPFVGSVGDGKNGLTAMDYCIENKSGDRQISAHKVWACHKNVVISLIANLQAKNIKDTIYTVLDQCRLQGEVAVNSPNNIVKDGIHQLNSVKWIYHHHIAYIPLKPATIKLKIGKVKGRWSSVNASESDSLVTDSVFMPVMVHNGVNNNSTGYVLAYCEKPKDAQLISQTPDWKILRNDKICQAVQFKDGTGMIAFFEAGQLKTRLGLVKVNRPCLLLIADHYLYVSDPSQSGGPIKINLNDKMIEVNLPKEDTTKKIQIAR